MPSADDAQRSVRGPVFDRRALVRDRESRTRVERIEHDERLVRRDELIALRTKVLRQLQQNALDLFLLFGLELAHAVADLERSRRLDEQRRASRGRAMHDSADGAAA